LVGSGGLIVPAESALHNIDVVVILFLEAFDSTFVAGITKTPPT
jgi:hypothetical protein